MRRPLPWIFLLVACPAWSGASIDAPLKLDYGPSGETSPMESPAPVLLAMNETPALPEPTLRIEYEILTRIERLSGTVRQIRDIVAAMPGQVNASLLAGTEPLPPLGKHHSTAEETLARIERVERLVADIARIIREIPALPARRQEMPALGIASREADHSGRARWVPRTRSRVWDFVGSAMALLVFLGWWLYRRRTGSGLSPPVRDSAFPAPAPHTAVTRPAITEGNPATGTAGHAPAAPNRPEQQFAGHVVRADTAKASQSLELAEIMVSMGLSEGAAQTLVEQIQLDPERSLPHWLRLLEIYRESGMREQYDQSARELKSHFNVQPGDWKTHNRTQPSASLEDYPRILAKVTADWRKPECIEYLTTLLEDNRGGTRAGFPATVAEEILLLISLQQQA